MKVHIAQSGGQEPALHVTLFGGVIPEPFRAEASRRSFKPGKSGPIVTLVEDVWRCLVAPAQGASDGWRQAGASAVDEARRLALEHLVVESSTVEESDLIGFIEGAILGAYRFDRYQSGSSTSESDKIKTLDVLSDERLGAAVDEAVRRASAVTFARDLANEPPAICTPEFLADHARELAARYGYECEIFEEQELEERGFNLILAVGRGSVNPPRLIRLTKEPEGEVVRRIALVGKGVTYDSGGYSMKPADYQENMHLDMGGAAAVLGCAHALGDVQLNGLAVDFYVPTAENLVSDCAFKVMDIVRGYAGTTVEVLNTDAEGRLLLADALAYAAERGADVMLDLATLTGACVVGLGQETAGVFGTDEAETDAFLTAAGEAGELVWELPLVSRIESQLKSEVADVKNIGGRWGGAISAALFLRRFVGDTPWIHVDLAGPAMTDKRWSWINKGGTGFGVLALERWIRSAADQFEK